MAREEELKRIDLKVNVSCCDGCRRKVMKAMSLKGVLRTEIQPSHDRVTVVGDVDVKVLVKKLARVGKIAEALPPAPAAFEQCKKRDDGDRAVQAQVEEKRKGKGDAGDKAAAAAASEQEGCKKCAHEAAARAEGGGNGDHGSGEKAPSPKDGTAGWTGEEGGDADEFDTKPAVAASPDHRHAQAQVQQHYHRAEPPTVVPVHVPAYYAPPAARCRTTATTACRRRRRCPWRWRWGWGWPSGTTRRSGRSRPASTRTSSTTTTRSGVASCEP
ncbi:hypothetical protein Zm00014a_024570 [Zea mays]|uniref:HMA domain-containing protein n=1 Tax=Zea mays TaxID=4577 RepID=A0A3L6G896_MAIZE|nr:hypothetical protein Zm00014a_024570 [Zea mays]